MDTITTFLSKILSIPLTISYKIMGKLLGLVGDLIGGSLRKLKTTDLYKTFITRMGDLWDLIKEKASLFFYLFKLVISFKDLITVLVEPIYIYLGKGGAFSYAYSPMTFVRLSLFAEEMYSFCSKFLGDSTPVRPTPARTVPTRPVRRTMPAAPQSGDYTHFILSAAFMGIIPDYLKTLLKDMSSTTRMKVFDDTTIIYDLFQVLIDIPRYILGFFLPTSVAQFVESCFDYIELLVPISKYGKVATTMIAMLTMYEKDGRKVHDAMFINDYKAIAPQFVEYIDKLRSVRGTLPTYLITVEKKFINFRNKLAYIESGVRKEPVFIVFSGPPGTGKSMLMGRLQQSYEKHSTVYVHSTPGEKDFYDQYDNEDIFVVDDVGQKSVSQWSSFINMVSTIKYPLDAAEVNKKGTKFFTSKLILASTNNHSPTLTPNCGISDLGALHRRMHLFDFSKVVFKNGGYTGFLHIRRFQKQPGDLQGPMWHSVQAINITDATSTVTLIKRIDKYIREQMLEVKQVFDDSFGPDREIVDLAALPQAGEFNRFLRMLAAVVAVDLAFHIDWYNLVVVSLRELISDISNVFNNGAVGESLRSILEVGTQFGVDNKALCLLLGGVVGLFGATYYYIMSGGPEEIPNNSDVKIDTSGKVFNHKGAGKNTPIVDILPQSLERVFEIKEDESQVSPPQLGRLKSNMYGILFSYINVVDQQVDSTCLALLSNRVIIVPYHVCMFKQDTPVYVTVYSSDKNIVYDKVKVTCLYQDLESDLAYFCLPSNLPMYNRVIHMSPSPTDRDMYLILPNKVLNVTQKLRKSDSRVRYIKHDYVSLLESQNFLLHDLTMDSLCGAVLVLGCGYVIGHHVAGTTEEGVIRLLTAKSRKIMQNVLSSKPEEFCVDIVRKDDIQANAAYLSAKEFNLPVMSSSIVPSMVHNEVFSPPRLRLPVNFGDDPTSTLKSFSKLSQAETAMPQLKHMTFVKEYISTLLSPWKCYKWQEGEVVSGDAIVGKIDHRTSVGYGLNGVKSDYLDYDRHCYVDKFARQVAQFKQDILDKKYPQYYFTDQLKDELRDAPKVEKPRLFRAAPLVHTCVGREYLGSLLSYFGLEETRLRTGVFVGINPFSEQWSRLMTAVTKFGDNVFDGDFSRYDKAMLSTFQQLISEVICEKSQYQGDDLQILEFMLNSLIYNPVVCINRVYMTTHSLPSGSFITSIFNSLIQKAYMAYCFSVLYERYLGSMPSIYEYTQNVYNATYGDDGLTGVSDNLKEIFNGPNVQSVMKTLGLDYTPGDKNEWNYTTRSIDRCTFLKRSFKLHRGLRQIVAPLQLMTMMETINYVRDDSRNEEITTIKLLNFQRESFLHEDLYPLLMSKVKESPAVRNLGVLFLEEESLVKLYTSNDFIKYYALEYDTI